MRLKGLTGKTVHLKLRYQGFDTITRNKTLKHPTSSTDVLFKVINDLFSTNYEKKRKVRLLGVGMSGFEDKTGAQLSLFEQSNGKPSELDIVEDLVRKKFGKNAISRAAGLSKTKDQDRWIE